MTRATPAATARSQPPAPPATGAAPREKGSAPPTLGTPRGPDPRPQPAAVPYGVDRILSPRFLKPSYLLQRRIYVSISALPGRLAHPRLPLPGSPGAALARPAPIGSSDRRFEEDEGGARETRKKRGEVAVAPWRCLPGAGGTLSGLKV